MIIPDPTTAQTLRGLVLGAQDLRELTNWPGSLIEDYLNILDNIVMLADLLDVEIDKELETLIYSMPAEKSYESAVSDIKKLFFTAPAPKNYDKIISMIEKIFVATPSLKSYDKRISDLEQLLVSNALGPSGDTEMPIFTSLGKFKIQKDLTFSNDTGTVALFTVTGDVFVNIVPVITTTLVPNTAANVRMGVVGNTDAMISDSVSTDLVARGIWVDQTPDFEIESTERIRGYIITDGNDINLTLSAQVNSGAITFYCFWSPLSGDGNVVPA